MKKKSIAEQRALIKQLRLEANNPEEKAKRILADQERAERHAAKAKQELEKWMMMKMLKGEWVNTGAIDIDAMAARCSVTGGGRK